MLPQALELVALLLSIIVLVQSKGSNLLAWAVACLALALTFGLWR